MTHSLEVAQLARSIARVLGLNEDLVEAIALAHDLGHTPFGHAGQDAVRGARLHVWRAGALLCVVEAARGGAGEGGGGGARCPVNPTPNPDLTTSHRA